MQYKNILVVAELEKNKISKLTKEILGKARELADQINQEVYTLLIGDKIEDQAQDLIKLGSDKVILAEDKKLKNYTTLAYTKILNKTIEDYNPLAILISATSNGRDLGGRICARRNIGLVAECADIKLTSDKKDFRWIRPSFDGQLFSDIRISTYPQIGTLGDSVFKPAKRDESRQGTVEKLDFFLEDKDFLTEILGQIEKRDKTPKISEAKIIVAGGLGLREPKNMGLIKELAEELGAALGGSKPLADQLWIPKENFIGVSGQKVKPKLYIAIGISGATQHLQGMRDSEIIVAINKDKDAPIMKEAHYAIQADLFEIVPILIEQIREKKKALN